MRDFEQRLVVIASRRITIDLDDTLWPVWPTIARAEAALAGWLATHAPATAALFGDAPALRAIRVRMNELRPDLRLDLSALRRESIRLALTQAIMALAPKHREIVLLYYYQDMSLRACAQVLGISAPTATRRLQQAQKKLRIQLEERG